MLKKTITSLVCLGGIVMLVALTPGCKKKSGSDASKQPLHILVGGTMRPVMEKLVEMYVAESGEQVEMDNGGSGELMVRIEQTGKGDIYICHDPFVVRLHQKGLCEKAWTTATLTPVIVVPKGNPKNIQSFRDLAKPGLRLLLTDLTYSTTGNLVAKMAEKAGLVKEIDANIVSRTRGGGQAADSVALGAADAAIVWNAVAHLRCEKLDAIPIDSDIALRRDVDAITSPTYGKSDTDYIRVTVATLKGSVNPEGARRFAEFVAAPENRKIWDSFGFSPMDDARPTIPGIIDAHGNLLVHCAAGMRLPVSEMAKAFEKKYGIGVELNFSSSNRLLAQIKLTRKGDVYIAGDAEYCNIAQQEGLAAKREQICVFNPVILTQKGNPHNIKSLHDMLRPGIRIGQGDQQTAIGKILPELLKKNGINPARWQAAIRNESATINDLALAIKLGTLDAIVVWDAVAMQYQDSAEIVAIEPELNRSSSVESVVLTCTGQHSAAEAFVDFMASAQGQEICRAHGYSVSEMMIATTNSIP